MNEWMKGIKSIVLYSIRTGVEKWQQTILKYLMKSYLTAVTTAHEYMHIQSHEWNTHKPTDRTINEWFCDQAHSGAAAVVEPPGCSQLVLPNECACRRLRPIRCGRRRYCPTRRQESCTSTLGFCTKSDVSHASSVVFLQQPQRSGSTWAEAGVSPSSNSPFLPIFQFVAFT